MLQAALALQEAYRYWWQREPYGMSRQQLCDLDHKLCMQLPHLSGMVYNQVFVHLTPTGRSRIKILTGSLKIQPWGHPSY